MATKMATKISSVNPTCPVCLGSFPVVKMLSTCKHVFCRSCLSIHLAKSSPESVVIPCPTCRVESPLPENGVDGLVDYTRDGTDEEGLELLGAVGGGVSFDEKPAESEQTEGNKHCLSCKFKPNPSTVPAESICEDCLQLPMCRDCTKVHSQNKATQDHVVTSLKHKKSKKEVTCKSHDQLMTSYCSTCAKLVCRACVMLEHGDHVIKKIGEIIRELLTDLSAVTKEKKKQLKALTQMETDLKEMKSTALGERDKLVKTIEDHAEKCIEEILNQKKVLKAKVNADYDVIESVSTCLERIPDVRQKLEDSVRQAESMASRRDVHPNNLEKIADTKESLVVSGKMAGQFDRGAYVTDYQRVQQRRPMFEPNTIEFTIGHLTGGAITAETVNKTDSVGRLQAAVNATPRLRDIRQCDLIFERCDMSYITSVANLGKKFAVSHRNPDRNLSKIDIQEFADPDNNKHRINNVKDLGHIASTPDGNLAVLYTPNYGKYFVSIFDSETSQVMSNTYLDNTVCIDGFSSFGVTARNDYVVCSAYQPLKVIVFRQDGSVFFSQEVGKDFIRTACSDEFVFACDSRYCIDAYALRENQLVFIGSCKPIKDVLAVSGTPDGEVTVLCRRNGCNCLGRSVLGKDGFSEWFFKDLEDECEFYGNISVGGRHIVASFDDNIRVFAEEG